MEETKGETDITTSTCSSDSQHSIFFQGGVPDQAVWKPNTSGNITYSLAMWENRRTRP